MSKRKARELEKNDNQKVNIIQEERMNGRVNFPVRYSKRLKSARDGQENPKAHDNCIVAPTHRRSHNLNPRKEDGNKLKQDNKNNAITSNNEPTYKPDHQVELDSFILQKSVSRDEHRAHSIIRLRQYWLLKAEPESRLEKGVDIKFSIDDLAAKTEPEPWDGIRNYGARNNLRSMKKGDLAFFYHSSCKVPAIVGIMEIVGEHTPDFSANDPTSPYYDAKDNPMEPKWSLVHVKFRQKLKSPITLKELKAWHSEKNHVLGNMQMLRLARMSVSKVEEFEWNFLISEMIRRGDELNWQV